MNVRALIVFVLACVVVVAVHNRLDRAIKVDDESQRQGIYVPSVAQVKLVDGGFDKLAADLFWLAFIQYTGVVRERGKPYGHSYDYIKLVTELDPHFTKPYWFGCWAVGYWQKEPDKADEILREGIRENPDVWELAYLAGINQYLFAKNYKEASRYYRLAARDPAAPAFVGRQAETLASDIPELVKRRKTLWELYNQAKDMNLKVSVYNELVSLLHEMYRDAPSDITRKAIEEQLRFLEADFEKNAN